MLKITTVVLLALNFQGNFAASVFFPEAEDINYQLPSSNSRISSSWIGHVQDFVDLIDTDKVLGVVLGYLSDPEVLDLITFVFSDEFKKIIWEFQSISEFKEAFKFLQDKGYDVDSVISFINTAMNLPPFEKPKERTRGMDFIRGTGVTGLIEDIIAVLPLEEMKKLFESKLETDPEVAELFSTINSPEFMEIMKKMSKNPKFIEMKETFANYGLDFKYLCRIAKDILGEYYQGIFCET